jgi:hypothetical protein
MLCIMQNADAQSKEYYFLVFHMVVKYSLLFWGKNVNNRFLNTK